MRKRTIFEIFVTKNLVAKSCFLGCLFFALGQYTALAQGQSYTVKGTVTDNTGQTVIGTTVTEKGASTRPAITDVDGKYSIIVSGPNAVLVFTSMGYVTLEQTVDGRTTVDVTLNEDAKQLDEVIVVGYGVQKKSSLTGALAAINDKKLLTSTTPKVENMLNGKAPGVFVVPGSGQPGQGAKIVIRGKTTVNESTDPLWVIDGVIVGNGSGDLNPADIETMTILKDAASTAIYGSQGSNGVIVVTTKKGRAGNATVNFSAKAGINKLNRGNLKVMNGSELYDLYASFSNVEALNTIPWWTPELRNRNYDWWDGATQTGATQDYSLSIHGGTDKLNIFASLGYYDETGAVKGYDYAKYTARVNVNYKMFDWLTIKPIVSISRRDIYDQQHSVSAMYSNLPWDSPYKKDGSLVDIGTNGDPVWVNAQNTNYLYDLQWNYSTSRNYEFMGNFDFDIKLTDWLTFASVNNYKFGEYTSMAYTDPRSSGGQSSGGSLENYFSGYDRIYTNQLFRINKTFSELHSINGILAYEWNEYNGQTTTGVGTNIPPGAEIADLAATPNAVKGGKSQWAVQSFFANANYSYANKYFLQGSLRRDGASNFGRNKQYGNFFSISGAWSVHEEAFFENISPLINNLKLRISYGSTGNRPGTLYPQYTLYTLSKNYSYNGVPGALISSVGNDNMTWETSYTANAGLDMGFFDNRLYFSFDIYNKNTSGLLYQTPLPGVWGVTSVWRNVGEVRNRGLELNIGGDIIRSIDMRWNIEANIGLNRNKVTKLYGNKQEMIVGDGSGIAGSANKMIKPGYDMDTWYLTEWAGVNPDNGSPQWYTTDAGGNRVITSDYADASKNPVMLDAYTPKFYGGFNTTFNYKNFDLNAVFSFSVGGKIYNYNRSEYDSDGTYTDRNQMKLMKGWSRWQKPGDIATHPVATYQNKSNSEKASSRFLEDGSYLKLRSVNIGYNIPVHIKYIAGIRVYVSGENLFTVTDYSGVDPEIPPKDGTVITGVNTSVYPSTTKVMFGINITF